MKRAPATTIRPGLLRPVLHFAWNAQGLRERLLRGTCVFLAAPVWLLLRLLHARAATRLLHLPLRGMSRDRLELLGREYFERFLRPRLATPRAPAPGALEHVARPIALHAGVEAFSAVKLDMRDGRATGRVAEHDARFDAVPRESPRVPPLLRLRDEPPLSVRAALRGKNILLLGATGFIGKVWLAHLLHRLPEAGRIHVLVRGKPGAPPDRRFATMVERSPVFADLQDAAARVEVHGGDMTLPGLGLDEGTRARLAEELDLVVSSAGITDFQPDLRQALAVNVDAVAELAEFVRGCRKAALLHLSTCYVAGAREGRIPEEPYGARTPAGRPFDPARERAALAECVAEAERRARESTLPDKIKAKRLRQELAEAGQRRATELGWANTYTFTKALGETLLRDPGFPCAVVRPSIVETSVREPFRGWNEGVNTSTPISYLLGTSFRQLPSRPRVLLDLIPVDLVCRGMTLVAAALAERRHAAVYQLATSGRNPCSMPRAIELTGLAHRRHYLERPDLRSQLLARCDTIPVSALRYRLVGAPGQRALFRLLPGRRIERGLSRVEKMIELYKPFIHDHGYAFQAERVEWLSAALPEDERDAFSYDVCSIDWREYWTEVHIPALRRWSYPLLEGRSPPPPPPRPLPLPVRFPTGAQA